MAKIQVHHVFPYHVSHFANSASDWWSVQLGAWPVAASLSCDNFETVVHVIGDDEPGDQRLVVHQGLLAGPRRQPYGADFSASLLRELRRLPETAVCMIHGSGRPLDVLCALSVRRSPIVLFHHGRYVETRNPAKDLARLQVVLRPDSLEALYDQGYRRVSLVVPSVSERFFGVRNEQVDRLPTIGFVGRPIQTKGFDAIRALEAELARHDLPHRIEVVGNLDVDERAASPFDRVDWLGLIPNSHLPGRMRRWEILAFPSRSEGCPRAVLEGLAAGLPAVSVRGVLPSHLIDDQGSLAVERENFAEAVVSVVHAPRCSVSSVPLPHSAGASVLEALAKEAAEAPAVDIGRRATLGLREILKVARRNRAVRALIARIRPVASLLRRLRRNLVDD